MSTDDENLWNYAIAQDQYVVQEFGLGIVGIGALFFAYSSISSFYLQVLIALVGLGGSFTMWMHMFGADKEFKEIKNKLSGDFVKKFDDAQSWRRNGINRFIYLSVKRLMTYFMGMVCVAWFTIILYHLGIPVLTLLNFDYFTLGFAVALFLYRWYKGIGDTKKKS